MYPLHPGCAFRSRIQYFCVVNSVSLILNGVMEKIWPELHYLFEGIRRMFYVFSLNSSKLQDKFLQDNIHYYLQNLPLIFCLRFLISYSICDQHREWFWLWPPRKHSSPHHALSYESPVPQYPTVLSPAHQKFIHYISHSIRESLKERKGGKRLFNVLLIKVSEVMTKRSLGNCVKQYLF